ncbi:hypothetical protein NDU88_005635 [Pleurodeles waltl]|uniref:Uncharacterized protein n=1 Tax=Pleurodeles waltl TaxID=8319 RepID=A0AAV7VJM4_PLEWA|nr:hypothetical protein NDU88_005635 [Pleurodeles waltl]
MGILTPPTAIRQEQDGGRGCRRAPGGPCSAHANGMGTAGAPVRRPRKIHASHTKKVACPLDHEEALLRVLTTVREITAPEKEIEAEPGLIEDGSITPVRDKGGNLQEGARELISNETAGEPNPDGAL